ncbi:MAG: class I SAM-dependent methyltransferase [Chlamydiota bacterium]
MSTFKLFFSIKYYNLKEYLRVIFRLYRNFSFCCIDLMLLLPYLCINPYRSCRKWGEKEKKTTHIYGETPLTTMETIAKNCSITSQDTVFELGSGRGRTSFFLHSFFGCSVIGIEEVPIFIHIAKCIKRLFRLQKISFRKEDFLQTNLSSATHIYLYGTLLSNEEITQFLKNPTLNKKTKMITISYPLSEFSQDWKIESSFRVSFPWGRTEGFLNTRRVLHTVEPFDRHIKKQPDDAFYL